ncbi:SpoIVB peptidase [Alkalihalobacillus pseudalcaliphilus]|uniref:SpoIVB peptidase n=1 Tax=Alkalihalobacillus pseudalcaliphilus TaxID=79884 RepID=UPI00064DAAC7|nr:SpoIVB peptidase [Alkalihalobacillus pseudalcaliphilus]KMK77004.1 peptidase S55 [Alkalihalobacillus pseudalcaliphilus]
MRGEFFRKAIGVLVIIGLLSLGTSTYFKDWLAIPLGVTVFEGIETNVSETTKLNMERFLEKSNELTYKSTSEQDHESLAITAQEVGEQAMTMVVGGVPIKEVKVNVLPKVEVIPGGQSIGVKLNTEGVLVVGHHLISTSIGEESPGEDAGIKVGDMIVKINDEPIQHITEVANIVQKAGEGNKPLEIKIKRNNQLYDKTLTPIKAQNEHSYRLGLYIRDSAAGIGTLTFHDPVTKKYGALGHVISDVDTKKPIIVHDGQIIRSSVNSIEKGSNGDPGEKLASFKNVRDILGSIEKNSPYGIFGTLKNSDLRNNHYDEAMPIAMPFEVKDGPAKILTVVNGEEIEEFDIEVVSSIPQKEAATKGMVIRVTDPKLLNATGGIVQGMSGSPIIQNGKIIGAVTHVFVNDPKSGYGCHISWMLEEAGVMEKLTGAKAS